MNKKTDINDAIIINKTFDEIVKQFNLNFLPDYCAGIYHGYLYVFSEDAYFESLDLDKLSYRDDGYRFCFLFEKNLYVDNALIQDELDFGPLVIIQGNVKAKNIFVGGGEFFFRGNVEVEQTLVAGVYNHGETYIDGTIEAELIMSFDHLFCYEAKNIKKGVLLGIEEKNNPQYEFKDVLKTKYYDSYEGIIKEKPILKALLAGESLLKSAKILSPIEIRIEKFHKSKSKTLDLSCMNLKDVPKEIFHIEDIVELDLSANYIEVLSEDILKLTNLKRIRLFNCEFNQFPEILLKIPNLEFIDLEKNKISNLPSDISEDILKLTNLKRIRLFNCGFNQFPEILLKIPSLESIDLGKNKISNLPSDILKLDCLKKLSLYNCAFIEFPEILYSLKKLEDLDLSYQQDQPAFVINNPLNSLKVLDISANFGVEINATQPKLQKLYLRNCSLSEISIHILKSDNLKLLDITLNQKISKFSEEIINLQKLESFCFSIISMDAQSIALLNRLPKLKFLLIQFYDKEPRRQIEDILLLTNWIDLYIEGYLEDMFLIKEILERPSLRKLAKVGSVSGKEDYDINKLRKILNVNL